MKTYFCSVKNTEGLNENWSDFIVLIDGTGASSISTLVCYISTSKDPLYHPVVIKDYLPLPPRTIS